MKICFITTKFDEVRGGTALFSSIFARLKTVEVTVIASNTKNLPPWLAGIEIPVRSRWGLYAYNDWLFARAVLKKLPTIQAKEKFDLIVVNQVIAKRVLEFANFAPLLYVIHHPVSVDRELALQNSKFLESVRWYLRYGSMVKTQKNLVQKLRHVVTVSQASQKRICHDYSVGSDKIIVIENGIDTTAFKRVALREPKTVLVVGSYQHPRRGFPYLLDVYRRLYRQGFRIFDVGRRTSGQENLLRQLPNVELLGIVDPEKLLELYSQASVFISTSLFEGFGLAAAEAMACETPVAAFSCGGIDQIVGPWKKDCIVSRGNTEALAAAAVRLDQMGAVERQKLREHIMANFEIKKTAERYGNLMRSIVGS